MTLHTGWKQLLRMPGSCRAYKRQQEILINCYQGRERQLKNATGVVSLPIDPCIVPTKVLNATVVVNKAI